MGAKRAHLRRGQSQWFAATYGNPTHKGSGSDRAEWTHDGQVLLRPTPAESRVAWEFQAGRPDTDHFNRDFKPELARGGTEICRINPLNGSITRLTTISPPAWDFRATESPDGKHIAFCRAQTGGSPELWVMNPDGQNQRLITRGLNDLGVDYPRWVG